MSDWDDRRHNLDYDSAVAMRYHGRRTSFLDAMSRLDPALTVILGGAAFTTIVTGHSTMAAGSALCVAIVSALNLAFGLNERARLHEKLFRQWGDIRGDLARLPENDEVELRDLEVKRAAIDAESPWQLGALSAICENEEKVVRRSGTLYKIGSIQRSFANVFTFPWWTPIAGQDASDEHARI